MVYVYINGIGLAPHRFYRSNAACSASLRTNLRAARTARSALERLIGRISINIIIDKSSMSADELLNSLELQSSVLSSSTSGWIEYPLVAIETLDRAP